MRSKTKAYRSITQEEACVEDNEKYIIDFALSMHYLPVPTEKVEELDVKEKQICKKHNIKYGKFIEMKKAYAKEGRSCLKHFFKRGMKDRSKITAIDDYFRRHEKNS
ncbi:hypothetical protein CWI38_0001p0130 [Hamiltosporidium tvaerminnensis]|uniref:Uncharacterized protein n=2 Tax=Hamiltosporidium TaxID=1176354 RepID=A0A4Q9LAL7_9MICR|nr:hypothetical protein LUQ84_001857 [Hamiltosporidium tvaerminnensis]TBU04847.1 hypothetical protein CWI37_0080p0010 [Hamiltosporidium tvaerminnensis]TBU08740.1 hypothetical protein CWI36_0102p0060 [Hamiltosporidium magnivora]TBU21042.1 hypothetical protein CWI38_0001p0130 [Hamiltosporidium tvaerminnensis]